MVQRGPDGLSPTETLARVGATAHALVAEQYRVLNEELLPALDKAGIRLLRRPQWSRRQERWARRYFRSQVLPVLTPIALSLAVIIGDDVLAAAPVVSNEALHAALAAAVGAALGALIYFGSTFLQKRMMAEAQALVPTR